MSGEEGKREKENERKKERGYQASNKQARGKGGKIKKRR